MLYLEGVVVESFTFALAYCCGKVVHMETPPTKGNKSSKLIRIRVAFLYLWSKGHPIHIRKRESNVVDLATDLRRGKGGQNGHPLFKHDFTAMIHSNAQNVLFVGVFYEHHANFLTLK